MQPIGPIAFPTTLAGPPSDLPVRIPVGLGLIVLGSIVGISGEKTPGTKSGIKISPPSAIVGGVIVLLGIGIMTRVVFPQDNSLLEA